jgi:hypothetical protein
MLILIDIKIVWKNIFKILDIEIRHNFELKVFSMDVNESKLKNCKTLYIPTQLYSYELMATRMIAIPVYGNSFPKDGSVLWALNVDFTACPNFLGPRKNLMRKYFNQSICRNRYKFCYNYWALQV